MSTVQDPPTSVALASADAQFPVLEGKLFLFSAEAFFKIIEANIFADEDRVELWDGHICAQMAKNKPHSLSSAKTMAAMLRVMPPSWLVWPENPVTLGPKRVPLPDYAVIRGAFDDYIDRSPVAADVGLIVELSDSSLRFDTSVKLAGYAEANIPAYWVVNLIQNVVQTYEEPIPAQRRYGREAVYAVGQAVPLRLDGVLIAEIPALDLLPVRA